MIASYAVNIVKKKSYLQFPPPIYGGEATVPSVAPEVLLPGDHYQGYCIHIHATAAAKANRHSIDEKCAPPGVK